MGILCRLMLRIYNYVTASGDNGTDADNKSTKSPGITHHKTSARFAVKNHRNNSRENGINSWVYPLLRL